VVGNAAVAGLVAAVGRPPAAPLVQRYINVVENKESLSAFNWAMEYEKLHKGQVDFARMRAAFLRIEATGEGFDTRAALFQRATEVIAAAKEQAVQPLWREPSAARVAIEIDYHFAGLKPQPKMTLVRTYPTSWDTTGGWGAEYAPPSPENNPHKWVIHVHRGPNGGLKSAKVKLWEDRELPQKGMGLSKLDQLPTLGIPTVDTATTHK
jgi:hypothetical protein